MGTSRKKAKFITLISAMATFFSFLYKLLLGYVYRSIIYVATAFSAFTIFLCKMIFVRKATKSREEKRRGYLKMAAILFIYAILFILVVVLRIKGIGLEEKSYEGWISTILALFIVLMFVLSIRGYRIAADRTDIMVLGLKEVGLATCFADLVVLEGLLDDYFVDYFKEEKVNLVHDWFSLAMGGLMVFVSLCMFIRGIRKKKEYKN